MDLLLIKDDNTPHYVYIKEFNRFMCNKTKRRNKKRFCRYCFQCFSSEKVFVKYINCLKVSGKQSVKLRNGLIKFNNHYKQLVVPFKIYADFESALKRVQKTNRDVNASYTEKYREHIPCSFAYKIVCIDDRFSKPVVLYRGKNAVQKFLQRFLMSMSIVEESDEKH